MDLLIAALGAAVPHRGALYLSTPITTGIRFVHWYLEEGREIESNQVTFRQKHREEVVLPNLNEAREVVRAFRHEGRLVLDPTSFESPGWSQDEYRQFWGQVIGLYASTVVLMDGWEYSAGCCYEFLVAVRESIPVRGVDGHLVSASEGRRKIEEAVALMRKRGVPADFNGMVAKLLNGPLLMQP